MSVEALKKFALDHYDEGGHWIYETFGTGDYECVLRSFSTLEEAKEDLKVSWELMVERETECRFE
jgi:hypothetical protein